MVKLLSLLACALLASCTDPPARLPPTGTTIRVALAPDPTGLTGWREEHHRAFVLALDALTATGDTWVEGEPADLRVRSFDAGERCTHAGEYAPGEGSVRVDYACAPGTELLAYAITHEALHWLTWRRARWVGHVCRAPGDAPDCTALVQGDAVLNPVLPRAFDGEGEPLGPPDPHLRPADLELLRAIGR
jgi:hypothetical protein